LGLDLLMTFMLLRVISQLLLLLMVIKLEEIHNRLNKYKNGWDFISSVFIKFVGEEL